MHSVFLTGGAGVVGRAMRRHLLENNVRVVCYDLASPVSGSHYDSQLDCWIHGDILDWSRLSTALKESGCSHVIHLAAQVATFANSNPREAIHVNVAGTANIAEAARQAGCKGIVYVSSRSVYGNVGKAYAHPTYKLVLESYRCQPKALYPTSKRAAEMVIERYAEIYDLPAVILRFGAIYGPGKSADHGATRVFSLIIEAAARGIAKSLGGSEQYEDFIYSEDIPRATYSALMLLNGEKKRKRSAQIFNIGSGVGTPIREFSEIVSAVTGVSPQLEPGTGVMGRDYRQSFVMSNSSAQSVLQYRPKYDLPSGIAHYAAMINQGDWTQQM